MDCCFGVINCSHNFGLKMSNKVGTRLHIRKAKTV